MDYVIYCPKTCQNFEKESATLFVLDAMTQGINQDSENCSEKYTTSHYNYFPVYQGY